MCCMIQNSEINKICMHVIHKLMMMLLLVVGGWHESMRTNGPRGGPSVQTITPYTTYTRKCKTDYNEEYKHANIAVQIPMHIEW